MNVFIDFNQLELKTFPISQLKEITTLVTKLFPARSYYIFIINMSETMRKKNWKIIEGK